MVTCLQWKPDSPDVLAVGYGELAFTPTQLPGRIAFWSLKHPKQSLWSFQTSCGNFKHKMMKYVPVGVTSLSFSQQHCSALAVGMYDGNIAIYNLQDNEAKEIMHSMYCEGKHTEPVWQVIVIHVTNEESFLSWNGRKREMMDQKFWFQYPRMDALGNGV